MKCPVLAVARMCRVAALLLVALQLVSRPMAFAQAGAVTEIRVPGKPSRARLWTRVGLDGRSERVYSLSLDGAVFSAPKPARYDLLLRYGSFDPLLSTATVPAHLRAGSENRLYIVQYWTQGIEDYRQVIRAQGGSIQLFLAHYSNVVEIDREAVAKIRRLPFVRAVVPFHPAYKLEEELLLRIAEDPFATVTVNLLTMQRGGQAPVARWIEERGGVIEHVSEPTYLMTATLPVAQLPGLALRNDVQWIDRWGEPGVDLDKARVFHGTNQLESIRGLNGLDVRVEVMDGGCDTTHPDMQNFIVHNGNTPSNHGTCTSGIIVGTGLTNAAARGCSPNSFLVIADYDQPYAGGSRYAHSGQLVNPALPYKCVLQSNSWGSALTTQYNSLSQDMDLILFDFQRLGICQSQSNTGTQLSRPEAWAKNIISVGGIVHEDTVTKTDDHWQGASVGPASDGRIKPDIASFFDSILCADRVGTSGYSGGNYYSGFNGTSGATPIVAGHLALIYQMWSERLFGNETFGESVFENAPNNTTTKALLVNSATPWAFPDWGGNLGRMHQGWGHPDLKTLNDVCACMFIVDEADVLAELESKIYPVMVGPGTDSLRVTLVYRDPPGTASSSLHRINDVDLTVTAPNGTVYRGNFGLLGGRFSQPGGTADELNTVENVFLQSPAVGTWNVMVTASEVNVDAHVETSIADVDYALVVEGAEHSSYHDDSLENNNSCATAKLLGPFGYGNVYVSKADEDWYRISAPSNETAVAELFFTGALGDVDMILYDACGGVVLDFSDDIDDDEYVEWFNPGPARELYLHVYVYGGSVQDCNRYGLVSYSVP